MRWLLYLLYGRRWLRLLRRHHEASLYAVPLFPLKELAIDLFDIVSPRRLLSLTYTGSEQLFSRWRIEAEWSR